jgi:beta-N-acetylhexosaminidase
MARDWPAPLDHAASLGENAERGFYLRHRIIAQELLSYGIDTSCAPMLDVAQTDTHEFLRNRCYGTSSEIVSELGLAAAKGLLDAGVLPIAKHIPGHGRAVLDSHLELPKTDASKEALNTDFAPFEALKDVPMAMTAHVVYEAYDDHPATTSEVMINVIREQIGFDGLLMCDDLSMQALSGSIRQRAADSLAAGCDVILHCNGDLAEMQSVAEEAGAMNDRATQRAMRALAARRPRAKVDIDALTAELDALTGR